MKHVIPFQLSASNHLFIQCFINENQASAIVDTGASMSCLSMQFAKQHALLLHNNDEEAIGIGNEKLLRFDTHVHALRIAEFEASNQIVAVLDFDGINATFRSKNCEPIDFIFGASFLIQFQVLIDYKNFCLIIE